MRALRIGQRRIAVIRQEGTDIPKHFYIGLPAHSLH